MTLWLGGLHAKGGPAKVKKDHRSLSRCDFVGPCCLDNEPDEQSKQAGTGLSVSLGFIGFRVWLLDAFNAWPGIARAPRRSRSPVSRAIYTRSHSATTQPPTSPSRWKITPKANVPEAPNSEA